MTAGFFESPSEASLVKSDIVATYFDAWSRVLARHSAILGYFDFFAGPGRYEDGSASTPLLILQRAVDRGDLHSRLRAVLNDADTTFAKTLRGEVAALPGIESLRYQPAVLNEEVNEALIRRLHREFGENPTLSFIDPWGYRGVTSGLIQAVLAGWGCEAIVFFNYSRLNAALDNPTVNQHVIALFGDAEAAALRGRLSGLSPGIREQEFVRSLGARLQQLGGRYMIPFRFQRESGSRLHYIFFVTKHPRGYEIMKDVMASRGVVDIDGVPRFEYLPPAEGRQIPFEIDRPLAALPDALSQYFAGRTLTRLEVYREHNIGTPFLEKHYRTVLLEMESGGLILCDPPVDERRRRTMAEHVRITFPTL